MANKLKKTLSDLSEKKKVKKEVVKTKKKKEELEKELEELEEEGEDDEEEEEDDDDEEDQDQDPEKVVTPASPSPDQQIEQEILRLRDHGVYHAEVLYQMIQNNSIQERIAVALEKIIKLVEK